MSRFRVYQFAMLAVGASVAAMIPQAANASRAALECDRLVAHPWDPQKPPGVAGLMNNEVDYYQALDACRAALADYPKNTRLRYQYGRAMHLSGRTYDALPFMVDAARGGYAIAKFSLGNIHHTGAKGLAASKPAAFAWYREAAADGVETAQVYAARMLDKGEGVERDPRLAEVYWRGLAAEGNREAIARMRTVSSVSKVPLSPPRTTALASGGSTATAPAGPTEPSKGMVGGLVVAAGAALSGVCYYFETCWSYFGDVAKEAGKEGVKILLQETMREKPKP